MYIWDARPPPPQILIRNGFDESYTLQTGGVNCWNDQKPTPLFGTWPYTTPELFCSDFSELCLKLSFSLTFPPTRKCLLKFPDFPNLVGTLPCIDLFPWSQNKVRSRNSLSCQYLPVRFINFHSSFWKDFKCTHLKTPAVQAAVLESYF